MAGVQSPELKTRLDFAGRFWASCKRRRTEISVPSVQCHENEDATKRYAQAKAALKENDRVLAKSLLLQCLQLTDDTALEARALSLLGKVNYQNKDFDMAALAFLASFQREN
eukprot:CAMPEP_0115130270 /NCGR_PEP_ID=MMETSP0227-20121206/52365_1 /TAXON_ID=89957 /ORGANISM="Polarella glacialis, Strain CCMP 1383" /LENGTH=111 /DNA_ID=CAMNT_0002535455 /DNA_START=45 /DNA_END=377 /DNA_ORIENTATION=-